MDQERKQDSTRKTVKTAMTGLAVGSLYDAFVANSSKNPRLMRYGLTFAALGVIHVKVEEYLLKRNKNEMFSSAAGAFAAGATFFGYKGRSISKGIGYGAALALSTAALDYVLDAKMRPSRVSANLQFVIERNEKTEE